MIQREPIEDVSGGADTPSSLDNEAATIWANAIRETGLWLSPFAENVAELGRLIIPRMQQAIRAARAEERGKGVADGGWVWEQLEMTHKAARAEGWHAAVKALREPHGLMIGHVARQHRYEQDALGYMRRAADWLADNKDKSAERTSAP